MTRATRQTRTTSSARNRLAAVRLVLVAALLFPPYGWSPRAEADDAADAFVLIVHPHHPAASVDRDLLARLFLKKTTYWPSGGAALPVDLPPGSPVRMAFSARVLRRSVPAVRSYWQQLIFSGRGVPPAELASDHDVVRFVLGHRGAVGYVSARAALGSAKALRID
jgi:ABC-type phosphate transport system substrate-binding protein